MVQIPDKQALIDILFPEEEEDFPLLRCIINTLYRELADRRILPEKELGTIIGEAICGNEVTEYHTFENLLWLILEAMSSVTMESNEWFAVKDAAMAVIYRSQSQAGGRM